MAEPGPAVGGRATVRRLPGGVRLPWVAGLLSLLLLAAGTVLVLGRTQDEPVPRDVLTARASIATATAESVRRGLDEAVDDLVVLATTLSAREEGEWPRLLDDFADRHERYLSVYVSDGPGRATQVHGSGRPYADLVPQPLPAEPGLQAPVEAGRSPVLLAWAPLRLPGQPARLLVGRYDAAFLRVPLEQLAPGSAWLVDARTRTVGSTTGFRAFDALPREGLRSTAGQVLAGRRYYADVVDGRVTSAARVSGTSPAGRLGLAVVADVDARSLSLPSYETHRLALLVAVLTALLALMTFFWLYLSVVAPLRRLVAQAERVAFGDRREPVHVVRYDEIGLVTRALERCRSLLVAAGPGRR